MYNNKLQLNLFFDKDTTLSIASEGSGSGVNSRGFFYELFRTQAPVNEGGYKGQLWQLDKIIDAMKILRVKTSNAHRQNFKRDTLDSFTLEPRVWQMVRQWFDLLSNNVQNATLGVIFDTFCFANLCDFPFFIGDKLQQQWVFFYDPQTANRMTRKPNLDISPSTPTAKYLLGPNYTRFNDNISEKVEYVINNLASEGFVADFINQANEFIDNARRRWEEAVHNNGMARQLEEMNSRMNQLSDNLNTQREMLNAQPQPTMQQAFEGANNAMNEMQRQMINDLQGRNQFLQDQNNQLQMQLREGVLAYNELTRQNQEIQTTLNNSQNVQNLFNIVGNYMYSTLGITGDLGDNLKRLIDHTAENNGRVNQLMLINSQLQTTINDFEKQEQREKIDAGNVQIEVIDNGDTGTLTVLTANPGNQLYQQIKSGFKGTMIEPSVLYNMLYTYFAYTLPQCTDQKTARVIENGQVVAVAFHVGNDVIEYRFEDFLNREKLTLLRDLIVDDNFKKAITRFIGFIDDIQKQYTQLQTVMSNSRLYLEHKDREEKKRKEEESKPKRTKSRAIDRPVVEKIVKTVKKAAAEIVNDHAKIDITEN